ncbi:DUF6398 domain-containing protein [Candidatus Leptofilum sp.]|uniref:DUF6398 domain-containing protein n=1 Tax=Candidatus Leptofilum sp. TaxID=3241576 RepID=UPI003B58CD0E
MAKKKSSRVPKQLKPKFEAITELTDAVCNAHLDQEYAEYARYLAAALARKRPSPIARGQAKSWAAGIVHALGLVNFLSDQSFEPSMRVRDLWKLFNVSEATGSSKSLQIRKMFDMYQFDPEWTLPSLMEMNSMAWMVQTPDGFIVDARSFPYEMQQMLAEAGIIPYVDADEPEGMSKSIQPIAEGVKQCKLCGNVENLIRTPCCNNWICDDADTYVMFSYARNSCYRNHDRYTLCAAHWHEDHEGRWQDCQACLDMMETEMYVYYGTNEYNFEPLKSPPSYEPTHCSQCNRVIRLAEDGYSISSKGYVCLDCANSHLG